MNFRNLPFIAIPRRQLYFLQLENYNLARYFRLISKSYRLYDPERQEIIWTAKLVAVQNLALFSELLIAITLGLVYSSTITAALAVGIILLILFLSLHFIFLFFAVLLISPADYFAKRRILSAAARKVKSYPNLKIIAVAGSYGKTTMKEILATVLSEKLNVLSTPGNLNTPLGISRTLLKDLNEYTEVLLLEMGEHYSGDLTQLTSIFTPDISVITGIAEAHLERFGSFEKLQAGIFEAAKGTKQEGLLVLNGDDESVTSEYKKYTEGKEIAFFSSKNSVRSLYTVDNFLFNQDGSGISFSLSYSGQDIGRFSMRFIGSYAIGASIAALIVGQRLGLAVDDIRCGLEKTMPAPHRLEVLPSGNGVLVIDDSYNGNPEGVGYAIEALSRFEGRRKVYITPGLVEGGERTEAMHREIGMLLAPAADIVVLIRNSVTPFISDELQKHGFPPENILWYPSALEAHKAVPEIVKTGDIVLFQNDWPDNYR